ncbi:MAG: PolC-type DNA polymerase III, partial [bacterium]
DALRFTVLDGKLMPSINSIQGLGETNAKAIAAEVKKGPFLSKEEFRTRTRSSTTITDLLETYGILGSLPETNQLRFDFA